jgi:hypothetical protein
MKTKVFLGLLSVMLFSATLASGQSRVVLDQSTNAVAYTKDNALWGLEINGKEVLKPQYQSVGFSNGLFKVQQADTWNVCGADGKMAFSPWIKAKDVKITDRFILFEEADGAKAVTYDRSTGKAVQATEITADAMKAEMDKKYGNEVFSGRKSLAEINLEIWKTQPRVERKGKDYAIMFQDKQVTLADEIIPLTYDYADEYWFFKGKDGGFWGGAAIEKKNPTKIKSVTILFKYIKIEDAGTGTQIVACTLPDGQIEYYAWSGHAVSSERLAELRAAYQAKQKK